MIRKAAILAPLLIILLAPGFSLEAGVQSGSMDTAAARTEPLPTQQVPLPASGGEDVLRVFEGKSLVVNSPDVLKRVSVTNDQIATAIVVSPNQVLIHGLKIGTVSLLLWNDQEQMRAFELQVLQNVFDLEALRATLSRVLPGENIELSQSGASIVLTGIVSSAAVADQAAAVVKTETQNVVNLLGTQRADQVVLLQVKFAEVDRNAVQQLGANIVSTGTLNTPGVISTQQFSPPGGADVTGAIGAPTDRDFLQASG